MKNKRKLRRRIRQLEHRVANLESTLDTLPSADYSDRLPGPLDPYRIWTDQVERYEHGGWDGEDWTRRGYL